MNGFRNSNTLVILDQAGNVAQMHKMIEEIESASGEVLTHVCKFKKAQDLADHLKTLLTDKSTEVLGGTQPGMQFDPRFGGQFDPRFGGSSSIPAASIRAAAVGATLPSGQRSPWPSPWTPKANSVTITAPAEKIAAAKKIIEEFDKGDRPYRHQRPGTQEVLRCRRARPTPISKTLLADKPSLRVIAVQAANEIWVMATPDEHFYVMGVIKDVIPPGGAEQKSTTIHLSHSDPTELVKKLVNLLPERQRRAGDRGRCTRHAVDRREGDARSDQGGPGMGPRLRGHHDGSSGSRHAPPSLTSGGSSSRKAARPSLPRSSGTC